MDLCWGRDAFRTLKGNRLSELEKRRCAAAVSKFLENPRSPGLNFERLGAGAHQNHWSIRASQELRVILAIDSLEGVLPNSIMVANFGHHDLVYDWAERQGYSSDISTGTSTDDSRSNVGSSHVIDDLLSFEEWQLFLHADQREFVERRFMGEARIYGGAGTGKTVIGLHRMARLASANPEEQFLVTAFHRSLIGVLSEVFAGIPNAPGNVEFKSVYQIAHRILGNLHVDGRAVDEAFGAACDRVIEGSSLQNCPRDYLRDEVERVIKGRSADRDSYLDTDRFQRVGRQRAFRRRDREICWQLTEAWDEEMRNRNTRSFADALQLAAIEAERRETPVFRAALVDEAQDLTATGLKLVRALVAGSSSKPVPQDALLVLEDRAQQIYSGGFRPAWIGLNFKGRSHRLATGRRTSRQIAQAAAVVRGQWLVDRSDTDDEAVNIDEYELDGARPCWIQTSSKEISTAIDIIKQLHGVVEYNFSDICLLLHRQEDAKRVCESLNKRGIPARYFKSQRPRKSRTTNEVCVSTLDSSKGMEFRAVLVLRLGNSLFPLTSDDKDALQPLYQASGLGGIEDQAIENLSGEAKEKRQLNIDRLYVGMTRARDQLFLVSSEVPCPEIEAARDYFDWYSPSRPLDPEKLFERETSQREAL